jgi:hypothetical protein
LERTLWLLGKLHASSERSLWIQGTLTSNSERGLFVKGKILADSERGLYLVGYHGSTRNLYLIGARCPWYVIESIQKWYNIEEKNWQVSARKPKC